MAEAYDFLIDAERGIVLREAALFEGKEYHVREMVEVAFDEDLSRQTFVMDAPSGAREEPARSEVRIVEVEEAARLTSFAIFAPPLPDEWQQRVTYFAHDERSGHPEKVLLRYWLKDATHQLDVYERPRGKEDPADEYGDWERVEREGIALEASTQEHSLEARVRREVDGTVVILRSDNLGLDALIEIALSLEACS